ncbi:Gfo/Idh/MocA family oxidoreductase [Halorussus gelatinilyticus]|uniref:Gfo/Idh/MocA family oxidoreductase n=1 Tax=Halorussus gelatinilyticus TaxID=2937524 RepID=A0A8U0IDG4_9EURY|nr:Gfo/Idh/MocA family oxidoreductase [Halorussus gelatinilyticus]UPV99096.1 Gfo/Idh/MocA family oxidoreductase [Halorussus gelatinilyticus]
MTGDTSQRTIRVGIVGLGGIGHHHAERIADAPAQLVGGVDISPDARSRFASAYGVPTFETFDALYDEGIDAAIVTTPNKFHEEYAVQALESGIDVLLEKPLANTLESAERIAEASRDADAFCMVGFNNRFSPAVEVFKSYQREGRFGELTHVEANWVRRRGIPGRGSWFTSEEVSGGGALLDIGVHAIDLALHFLDFPEVVEVTGDTRSEFGDRDDYTYLEMYGEDVEDADFDVDDHASAYIRTADGKSVSLEVAWATNRPPTNDFVVQGTDGGATFDRESGDLTVHQVSDTGAPHFTDTEVETRTNDTHKREQRAFFEAVRAGEAPDRNTVEEALTVQRVIDAIYRSAETGRAVELADETDAATPERVRQ